MEAEGDWEEVIESKIKTVRSYYTHPSIFLGKLKINEFVKVDIPCWEDPPFTDDQMETITYVVPVKELELCI